MHLCGWYRLDRVPIYAKVCLAPGLILIVLVLYSLAFLRMQDAAGLRLRAISEQAFPTYQRAAETKDAVDAVQIAIQHMLSVAANESEAARLKAMAGPVRQAIPRAAAALDALRKQIGDDQTGLQPGKSFEAYQGAVTQVLEAALSDPATASMLMADADEQFAHLSEELDGYKNHAGTTNQARARDAIQATGRERWVLLTGLALAIGICGGVMAATSRAIGRPVVGLTLRMAAMADEDLDREIPALDRGDEIGAMARAVDVFRRNGLQARVHAAERRMARAAKERHQVAMKQHTDDFGRSISGVMASLGRSADEMRGAAATMAAAAAKVFSEASVTAEAATKASLDLAAVATGIEQLTLSVDEISHQVATATKIAREAVRSAEAGQGTMRDMNAAASRISNVVQQISTIAERTNLLALNATIERRAGTAGKGFAVVANEVKALAAMTAQATSNIDGQIASVSSASKAALSAMVDVAAVIGKMDEVAGSIAAAIEQQTATTRTIATNVQAISGSSDHTARAMREVAAVAENAGNVSYGVQTAANAIGREAENLRSEVNEFLLAVRDDVDARLKSAT